MERLVNELGSLLKMLDHETVSPATADKMASIRNIMDSMQLGRKKKCHVEGVVCTVCGFHFSYLISYIRCSEMTNYFKSQGKNYFQFI